MIERGCCRVSWTKTLKCSEKNSLSQTNKVKAMAKRNEIQKQMQTLSVLKMGKYWLIKSCSL